MAALAMGLRESPHNEHGAKSSHHVREMAQARRTRPAARWQVAKALIYRQIHWRRLDRSDTRRENPITLVAFTMSHPTTWSLSVRHTNQRPGHRAGVRFTVGARHPWDGLAR
jgi:hypothetical protein